MIEFKTLPIPHHQNPIRINNSSQPMRYQNNRRFLLRKRLTDFLLYKFVRKKVHICRGFVNNDNLGF